MSRFVSRIESRLLGAMLALGMAVLAHVCERRQRGRADGDFRLLCCR